MVRAQIHRYISRPKYMRQSPDCPLVIFSFTALPSCLHCSTSYSFAFAQHCIVARPPLPTSCTRVHPHHLYPSRVSPSDPVSLLQVRPLPTISSESQQAPSAPKCAHYTLTVTPNASAWGFSLPLPHPHPLLQIQVWSALPLAHNTSAWATPAPLLPARPLPNGGTTRRMRGASPNMQTRCSKAHC